jgi:tetratricopeptide (TPR) repeat protein
LSPTTLTVDDAESLSEFLSCRRIDRSGGLVFINMDVNRAKSTSSIMLLLQDQSTNSLDVPNPASDVVDPSYIGSVDQEVNVAVAEGMKDSLVHELDYQCELELNSHLYVEAGILAQKSLSLDESNIAALDHLAHAYSCQGRFAEALNLYKRRGGESFLSPKPWEQKRLVGADLTELSEIWPDGSSDPAFTELVQFHNKAAGVTRPATEPAPAVPSEDQSPAGVIQRQADAAVKQFNLGNVPQSHELLRTAVRRANSITSLDGDTSAKVLAARSLIDPPSTRPADSFSSALMGTAWDVVKLPENTPERYRAALDAARHAVAVESRPDMLRVLGAAEYRAADYEGAARSLTQSIATDFVAQENQSFNLSFLAMAHQRLGHHEEALKFLLQNIELAKEPYALNNDAKAILDEAAALVDPAGSHPTTAPANDVQRLAFEAMGQFRTGNVVKSRELLRRAARAANQNVGDADTSNKIYAAKSLIDPPSTQPGDDFSDGVISAANAVIIMPALSQAMYGHALKVAQLGVAISSDPYNLSTYGAAQFRAGDYKHALETLSRADAADFVVQDNHAFNLLFTAMADAKLGRHDDAKIMLRRVIDLSKELGGLDADDKTLLQEAAGMIDPASTQPATRP